MTPKNKLPQQSWHPFLEHCFKTSSLMIKNNMRMEKDT